MMPLFAAESIQSYFHGILGLATTQVNGTDRHQVLATDSAELAQAIAGQFLVEPLEIRLDEVTQGEPEYRPPHQLEYPGNPLVPDPTMSGPKHIAKLHVPFCGAKELWNKCPTYGAPMEFPSHISIQEGLLTFTLVNWTGNNDGRVAQKFKELMCRVEEMNRLLTVEIEEFNAKLPKVILAQIEKRKKHFHEQIGFADSLQIPMRKANLPRALEVPVAPRPVVVMPAAKDQPSGQEWVLAEDVYQSILEVMNAFGKGMERHPSTYAGKDEEDLRDLFLMLLTPYFDSVTGEAFNKGGKTDILIRHQQQNVFVAECKFWHGPKEFLDAIDQLFRYLTWRDTRTAILLFVKGQKIETVCRAVESKAKEHECFIAFRGAEGQGRFRFDFHLKGDESRRVHLTVMCFHFPES